MYLISSFVPCNFLVSPPQQSRPPLVESPQRERDKPAASLCPLPTSVSYTIRHLILYNKGRGGLLIHSQDFLKLIQACPVWADALSISTIFVMIKSLCQNLVLVSQPVSFSKYETPTSLTWRKDLDQ